MNAVQPENQYEHNFALLMPSSPNKDVYSRILFFLDWLERDNLPSYRPTPKHYKHYDRRPEETQTKAAARLHFPY